MDTIAHDRGKRALQTSAQGTERATMDRGPWIQTFSGARWFVSDPRPEEVPLLDVVHALSLICRFGGHCRVFYSVLEHSVRVARELQRRHGDDVVLIAHGAWHDASEGLLIDVPRPIKELMPEYRQAEGRTQAAILARLGMAPLRGDEHGLVKGVDDALLATEQRDLMNPCGHSWTLTEGPLAEKILPWTPKVARVEFMWLLREIGGVPAELERGML